MKTAHIALTVLLAAAGSLSQAADQKWTGVPQYWTWSDRTGSGDVNCQLEVTSVTQPSAGGPVVMSVKNVGNQSVSFAFGVRVTGPGRPAFQDRIRVAGSLPGALSRRQTNSNLSGSLQGAEVVLSLQVCERSTRDLPVTR